MKNFRMTKLAAAIGVATMSLALAPSANAVVVVGGDNGWEVSFDGNVNAFYTHMSQDDTKTTVTTTGGASASTSAAGHDDSRVHSGFLPAFFSFNVKSPTVNGLTATGRFSFAPSITQGKAATPRRPPVAWSVARSTLVKSSRTSKAASVRSASVAPFHCTAARRFCTT